MTLILDQLSAGAEAELVKLDPPKRVRRTSKTPSVYLYSDSVTTEHERNRVTEIANARGCPEVLEILGIGGAR